MVGYFNQDQVTVWYTYSVLYVPASLTSYLS